MQSSTNSCWKYFCALSYSQQDLLCFQQDGTTAHTAEISMQVLRTMFLANSFLISGHYLACLTMQYQTNSSGSTLKARYMKYVLPIFCHKASNSGVYKREPQGNATMCYDSLCITTAGVF